MFDWDKKKRVVAGSIAVSVIVLGSILGAVYQPQSKTDEIYSAALEDFSKGNYQNAYYLFSKVTLFSNLKPVAIYHRAECARCWGFY